MDWPSGLSASQAGNEAQEALSLAPLDTGAHPAEDRTELFLSGPLAWLDSCFGW